ncbi:carboxymuconolactone decarboxylase family protein [Streptomyces pacificus]|uniref:Alkylhydroperoxidase n=1 Tax=Streptomyces pacificus TaxID=2705029 RepID=A0A6A0B4E9_9ACTN|nr:carboxymuconolactone decarboxylase family protein [Streptomyces pacificus]GFH39398.1 alkylhydroperoxidase [Streptomyces pacificus]
MTTRTIVRAVLRGSLRDIRHVKAASPGRARGLAAAVYAQAEREFGVIAPPLALHSASPGPLAASWLLLRESLLVEGRVDRAVKEAVATEVSRANSCSYCVDVHQAAVETLPPPAPGAPGAGASAWLRAGPDERGPAPFTAEEAPEILGVALTFHYLNRMVGVFLDDSPVPERAPAGLRGPLLRTVARTMRPVAGPLEAGAALDLLPPAPLPRELAWAAPNPAVAQALARSRAAVDRAARWVPVPVRELLSARLDSWDGTPPGISRVWLNAPLTAVPPAHHPAARLILLTALAPHQATGADIAAFRVHHPTDRELIDLTSWAALTTAATLTARLAAPPRA